MDTFPQDCDLEVQGQAADHLARQSLQVTVQAVGAAAWQQVPTTYLVGAQDRGTPPRLQREFARRGPAASSNSTLATTRSASRSLTESRPEPFSVSAINAARDFIEGVGLWARIHVYPGEAIAPW